MSGGPVAISGEEKEVVLERLLRAHEAWFDVVRGHEFAGRTFPGYAEFHSSSERYVLVKRAKLWGVSNHEYLFFDVTDRVASAYLDVMIPFMEHEAIRKVTLDPDHMSSFLSLVVVADEVDDSAARTIRRTRFRKNFAFGFKGWADLRLAAIDLSRRQVFTNPMGKELRETLEANLGEAPDSVPAIG